MQLTNERKQSEVHQVISEKAQLDNMLKSKDYTRTKSTEAFTLIVRQFSNMNDNNVCVHN